MAKIIWIASYPKSGNTWVRVFVENLRSELGHPVNINQLNGTRIASSRSLFDQYTGIDSSNLTDTEIDEKLPMIYEMLAEESDLDPILKVHDAWRKNQSGKYLFPAEISRAVIYVIRNPLDIAVSSAYHHNISFDAAVQRLNSGYALCDKTVKLYNQIRQDLRDWSTHVKSWVWESGHKVTVVRYEDLLSDPRNHFMKLVDFLGWSYSAKQIERSIEFSRFEVLKNQEVKSGFREKPLEAKSFFREGRSGQFIKMLSQENINSIYSKHKELMDHFGYS